MENKDIKVSVIMPVYNSGVYLKTAVESVLNQSLKEIELILVDDGSTDGSSEQCDGYAQKDSRVVVIHQKNGGICNARNAALKIAKGEYIGFSDHDDEYLPGFTETAYNAAKQNDADFVKVGKRELIIKDQTVLRTKQSCLPSKVYTRDDIRHSYFELVNSDELDCIWDSLIRRELLVQNNLRLDEIYKNGGEDIDFIQRILPYVNTFVTIGNVYYIHYIRKSFSTSSKFDMRKIEGRKRIISTMLNTISQFGIDIECSRFEYTYFLLRQYIAPYCALLSNEQYRISVEEKIEQIKAIKSETFYLDFCNKQNVLRAFRMSSKYGLLYFFFKYGFYNSIIKLYRKRSKYT